LVSGAACGVVEGQAAIGGPVAGRNTWVHKTVHGWAQGPVRGKVQHVAALWSGQPGGHADDVTAPGCAASDGMRGAGESAGGAEQVVGDGGADRQGAVGGEPAERYLESISTCS
jgi:hypothetical protein